MSPGGLRYNFDWHIASVWLSDLANILTIFQTLIAYFAISLSLSLVSAQFFGFGSPNSLATGDFGGPSAFAGNIGSRDPRGNRGKNGKNRFTSFHTDLLLWTDLYVICAYKQFSQIHNLVAAKVQGYGNDFDTKQKPCSTHTLQHPQEFNYTFMWFLS